MSTHNYGNIGLDVFSIGATAPLSTELSIDWGNIKTSTVTIGPVGSSYSSMGTYTIAGSNGTTWASQKSVYIDSNGVNLNEDCDIKIGDWSLKEFAKKMEERLAILTPNPQLEEEWEELKELGNQYRELENKIKAKMKTWDILKRED